MRTALFPFALVASLSMFACHDKKPAEGPAEYTGRKLDETGRDAVDGVKRAGHEVKCDTKNAKDDLQKQPRQEQCKD